MITGYKAFYQDKNGLYCQPCTNGKKYRYKEGEICEINGELKICKNGIHFCENLKDVFDYYPLVQWVKVYKVEILGDVIKKDNKSCTNKLKILEEVTFEEIVNNSNGVNRSFGVNGSDGVNCSFGVLNCKGVSNALFLTDKKETYSIFGTEVSKIRYKEVKTEFYNLLKGWRPTFNNLKSLYLKFGSEWKLTPIQNAEEIQKEEAWKDMPIAAIKYVMSLEEFDKDMFFKITSIDTDFIKEDNNE
ncbi:putative pentapeptide repeats (8 copies) [Brachyspira pilosicoli B2904]|uniref:Putative pentapeptide repeats (8 copies) n=1 Tax=Brachyspira pilosicoli B2904 TaxID=1133568 RepID=J9UPK9_BRAPL|nr:hypothetical protein [Brachyspira pilosicoli]AFR69539.1 putative pentapeptide repeats (8 copies) [Brachyspira pilosicoli B2904]